VQLIHTIAALRPALEDKREIALVPTMGNLHDGHLSLVRIARERPGTVVASIFVNRLQFAPHEDFREYPRTLERDCQMLEDSGCDIVFAPTEEEIYPEDQGYRVHPQSELANILEGQLRPGFFTGVCTVVLKLLNIVQPSSVVFGKKDFQQLLVIKKMLRQLSLPIELLAGDTIREASGLALSSRNGYLDDAQRIEAAQLHATLQNIGILVRAGRSDWPRLEAQAIESLSARGWRPEYVSVRRQKDLSAPTPDSALVVLAAARLGGTRLIDNLEV
jgi:pantoate--beta-alanine ligase